MRVVLVSRFAEANTADTMRNGIRELSVKSSPPTEVRGQFRVLSCGGKLILPERQVGTTK
jgi:hypothetical protein